jgi:hypothetical protein
MGGKDSEADFVLDEIAVVASVDCRTKEPLKGWHAEVWQRLKQGR